MRRHLPDLLVVLALATIVAVSLAFLLPGSLRTIIAGFVLVVGAVCIIALVSAFGDAVPRGRRSELTRALDAKPDRAGPVRDLERMQRVVTLSVASAHDLHTRLLPILRDIAAARLERTGKRPSEETLGRWWELLRPDRPAPDDRFAPGIAEADLRAVVADLARM